MKARMYQPNISIIISLKPIQEISLLHVHVLVVRIMSHHTHVDWVQVMFGDYSNLLLQPNPQLAFSIVETGSNVLICALHVSTRQQLLMWASSPTMKCWSQILCCSSALYRQWPGLGTHMSSELPGTHTQKGCHGVQMRTSWSLSLKWTWVSGVCLQTSHWTPAMDHMLS